VRATSKSTGITHIPEELSVSSAENISWQEETSSRWSSGREERNYLLPYASLRYHELLLLSSEKICWAEIASRLLTANIFACARALPYLCETAWRQARRYRVAREEAPACYRYRRGALRTPQPAIGSLSARACGEPLREKSRYVSMKHAGKRCKKNRRAASAAAVCLAPAAAALSLPAEDAAAARHQTPRACASEASTPNLGALANCHSATRST